MRKIRPRLRIIWFLLLYILVIAYTLTFPTTVAWFMFYVFSAFLVFSYLSTRHFYIIDDVSSYRSPDGNLTLSFNVRNKRKFPFFLSSLKLTVSKEGESRVLFTSAIFRRTIESRFFPIQLPRGHHDHLMVEIEGIGLFGFWKNDLIHRLPLEVDVYPAIVTKSERSRLVRELTPLLNSASHSSLHEYYVKEIRTFQNRDALAGIDWKSSLKRGQWMVKDYEPEEETSIALYFIGTPSPQFEDLLSIAYSLYKELASSQKTDLFLLGQFHGNITAEQTENSFLTIQPAADRRTLKQLWNATRDNTARQIIVTSKNAGLSLPTDAATYQMIIDEDAVHAMKGGQPNDHDFKEQTSA